MIQVLNKADATAVMFGDCVFLDDCAKKSDHTNLMTLFPMVRHGRIFRALETSGLFSKYFIRLNGFRGNNLVRIFYIKGKEPQKDRIKSTQQMAGNGMHK